jgi:hypothetical protein
MSASAERLESLLAVEAAEALAGKAAAETAADPSEPS